MNHQTDIFLVDPHSKSRGSDHYPDFIVYEIIKGNGSSLGSCSNDKLFSSEPTRCNIKHSRYKVR